MLTAREEGWDDHDSHWALRLSDMPEVYEEDARALLAHATARAVISAASENRQSFVSVLRTLKACDWSDVCGRLSALALASSEYVSQNEADAFIDSDEAVEPPSRKAEVATAVRVLFSKASSQAKNGFVRRIEAGPQWGREVDESTSNEWQRTRLRWFHDRLPPELAPLAATLKVTPRIPDPRQMDLDEIGFHVGDGSWHEQEAAPASPADLGTMPAEAVANLVEEWQEREAELRWREVSGADHALREFGAQHPDLAIATLQALATHPMIRGRYFTAILSGLRRKLSQVAPGARLDVIATVLRHAVVVRTETTNTEQDDEWIWTAREALEVIIDCCAGNMFNLRSAEAVWRTLEIADVNAFPARGDDRDVSNVDNLLSWAHSTYAGRLTRAVIEAGLWHYRTARTPSNDTSLPVDLTAVALVNPFIVGRLDAVLRHSREEAAVSVLATVGEHVPFVQLLARDWLLEHQEMLFERTTSLTGTLRPGWAGYVCLSQLVWSVFRDFRAWYSRAFDWPVAPPQGDRSPQHIPDRQAAFHVTFAFLSGIVNFDDADRLLQRTFDRISVDDRNAVYWEIGHNLSAAGSLDRIPRILELWRWRLDAIKGVEANDAAKESHGLADLISNRSLPRDEAMPLGLRSLQGARGQVRNEVSTWRRLQEWSADDPSGAFAPVNLVVRGSLAEPWALLTFEMVAPTLRNCLGSADADTIATCRRLIQDMGERGLEEFGRLLNETDDKAE